MSSISWVTVIWSMAAAVGFTLAAMYFLVWCQNRAARSHFFFALTAGSAAIFAFFELAMMRAQSPEELNATIRWAHLPLMVWLLSLTWFVAAYLEAGRHWLMWTILGLRILYVLPPLLLGWNPSMALIPSLQRIHFLGESIAVNKGVPNPWMPLGSLTVLLILIFVADASVTAWRRGDRRKALIVGGSAELFLLTGLVISVMLAWTNLKVPQAISLYNLALVAVMGHELSRNMFRASQLVHAVQAQEAVLRESKQQISDLFGRLIVAREAERKRIARDLHDDVSQRVAGLSIMLSSLKARLGGQPDAATLVPAVTSIQERTKTLAHELRHLSHELHPTVLEHVGLGTALTTCCDEFETLHSIAVTCRGITAVGPIETDTALCLYRITQEALRNVAKHADARHVDVTLRRTPEDIQLLVADDGKGFDLSRTRGKGPGLGLVSIDERVRLLHGTVRIETQPGAGTRIQVAIPHPLVSHASARA